MVDVVLLGVADLPYYPIGIQMYGGLPRVVNSLAIANIPHVVSNGLHEYGADTLRSRVNCKVGVGVIEPKGMTFENGMKSIINEKCLNQFKNTHMQITINKPLPIMEVKELTFDEVLNHSKSKYNPSEWVKAVNRYKKQKNVVFLERFNSTNDYPELFAIYTIDEGIRLINEVSYGGSMVNSPFVRVIHEDEAICTEKPFADGYVANNKQGREWMAKMSSEFGWIFSNKLPLSKSEEVTFEIKVN
jgi:hypothetical protein